MRASGDRATYADLERLGDDVTGELLSGELFASPRPAARHVLAAAALGAELGGPFQQGRGGPGGCWILPEPELWLDGDVLVPDLAGWRKERLPRMPEGNGLEVAPDWVCEILSPSTARLDLTLKLPRYAGAGVQFAWLVDPANRLVQAFKLAGGRWALVAAGTGEDVLHAEPFESVGLELWRLWGG